MGLVFGVAMTEDRGVRSVGSNVLCDADWDIEFEDLPAKNGRSQLLDCKCSWLHFPFSSVCLGMLMVLTGRMPNASSYRWSIHEREAFISCKKCRHQSGGDHRCGS